MPYTLDMPYTLPQAVHTVTHEVHTVHMLYTQHRRGISIYTELGERDYR